MHLLALPPSQADMRHPVTNLPIIHPVDCAPPCLHVQDVAHPGARDGAAPAPGVALPPIPGLESALLGQQVRLGALHFLS